MAKAKTNINPYQPGTIWRTRGDSLHGKRLAVVITAPRFKNGELVASGYAELINAHAEGFTFFEKGRWALNTHHLDLMKQVGKLNKGEKHV